MKYQTQTQSQSQINDGHIISEQSYKNESIGGNEDMGIGDTVQHEGIGDKGSNTDYPESSSEDEGIRKKPLFPIYNPKIVMSKSTPVLGMRFGSPKKLKRCLTNYFVSKTYPIKFDRNDHRRLLTHCENGRPWRLYVTYMQDERSFQIKSYKLEHKCVRCFKLPLVNSKWLAKQYNNKIQSNPRWKLK